MHLLIAATSVWDTFQPHVASLLAVAVPALIGALVQWLKEAKLRSIARSSALQVELECLDDDSQGCALRKRQRAIELFRQASTSWWLRGESEERVRALIESQVPAVEAEAKKQASSRPQAPEKPVSVTIPSLAPLPAGEASEGLPGAAVEVDVDVDPVEPAGADERDTDPDASEQLEKEQLEKEG